MTKHTNVPERSWQEYLSQSRADAESHEAIDRTAPVTWTAVWKQAEKAKRKPLEVESNRTATGPRVGLFL